MSPACSRVRLGPIQNPARGGLDVLAAALSLAAAVHLWEASAHWPSGRLALGVFSATQLGLCLVSALYHSVPWGPRAKRRMQRLDHAMIFLQIAGVVTPLALIGLEGPAQRAVLVAAWGIAAGGVVQKALFPRVHEKACIPFQVLQAALVLPALPGLAGRFEGAALQLLALAGAIHTVGLVVFVTERPRLWPRLFSFHELFHLLLLGGGAVNYTLLVKLLAKAG
jgi:hemolysin III